MGDIVGKNVYEADGATIGDIDYIVGSSGAASAVIGIGGFLGLGEYTVALPLGDFTYDADQQMVKISTTKDVLKEQPEFDETDTESLPDETRLCAIRKAVALQSWHVCSRSAQTPSGGLELEIPPLPFPSVR